MTKIEKDIEVAIVAGQLLLDQPGMKSIVGDTIANAWISWANQWREMTTQERRDAEYRNDVQMFSSGIFGEHESAKDETRRAALAAMGMALDAAAGRSKNDRLEMANMSVAVSHKLYVDVTGIADQPEDKQVQIFRMELQAKAGNQTASPSASGKERVYIN